MRNTTMYGLGHTKTFRRNSSGIIIDFATKEAVGTNLQNIEKSVRSLYWADEGKCLVQCDQSGAEAKIVAYLCRNAKFRSLFLNNVKPHVFVALHVFADVWEQKLNEYSGDIKININEYLDAEIPDLKYLSEWKVLDRLIKDSDNWSPAERYYFIAKQICHSCNYGAGANAFILNTLKKSMGRVALTKAQAEKYLLFYHSLFPELSEWHRQVQSQVEKTKMLYNLFGFPYQITSEITSFNIKELYAWVPQSTVGTITAIAYTRLYNYIKANKLDWDLLADTHDSYLIQCPIGEEKECGRMAKFYMEQDLVSLAGENFQMGSEVQVGLNWGPYKKGINEDGLKEMAI